MNKLFLIIIVIPIQCWGSIKSDQEILEYLDYSNDKSSVLMLISVVKDKDGKKQVFELKDDGDSKNVLSFLDKRQKGQKILTTDDGVWFISNKTRKAIKIPAIQRLFGDASVGDVSRLRFSRDYLVSDSKPIDQNTRLLSLKSNNLAATYHSVDLYVNISTYFPIKADFYTASGKHLKSVEYLEVDLHRERPIPIHWKIISVDNGKSTSVKINKIDEINTHPREFSKKFLQLAK